MGRRLGNKYLQINDNTVVIYTNKGDEILVSPSVLELLLNYTWTYSKVNNYVRAWDKDKCIALHRLLFNFPTDCVIDHINGNTLDNRRENLRLVSKQQNNLNRKTHKNNKLKVKGVYYEKRMNKYRPYIRIQGKLKYLGSYETLEEAKEVRAKAELEYFGEFARR